MALTFQAGTTVVISNGTTSRELLVRSATASQTYLEETRSIKTLHSPNNIPDTFSNSKSAVSLELDMYLTIGDTIILEWFGMSRSGNRYTFSHIGNSPVAYTVYIKATGTIYRVTNCHLSNMVFKLDGKSDALAINLSATGSDMDIVASLPALTNTKQSRSDLIYGGLTVSGVSNLIAGVTVEASKSISWVQNKTLHSAFSGSVYTPNSAYIEDFTVGGTWTRYKSDNVLPPYSTSFTMTLTYGGKFVINLSPCKRLGRWDIGDVIHKVMHDFKLLPGVSSAYLEFL